MGGPAARGGKACPAALRGPKHSSGRTKPTPARPAMRRLRKLCQLCPAPSWLSAPTAVPPLSLALLLSLSASPSPAPSYLAGVS